MRHFVVLTTQRSGSTWLVDKLHSHPDITAFEGVFMLGSVLGARTIHGESGFLKWNTFRRTEKLKSRWRPINIFQYLDAIYFPEGAQKDKSRGIKLMYNELLRYPEILFYIKKHKLSIIHLYRANIFHVIVSQSIMDESGQAHYVDKTGPIEQRKIYLDPRVLKRRLYRKWTAYQTARLLVRGLSSPYISVSYEDLCEDESRFDQLVEFIGHSNENVVLKSNLRKINRSSYEDRVSNFEEVRQAVTGTRFADMVG